MLWMRNKLIVGALLLALAAAAPGWAADGHTTEKFHGAKANTGDATHSVTNGKHHLKLSKDFVVPDTPAPHWQVVDSKGNVYLLNRLVIKDDKYNQSIQVPSYVHDIVKVQIWCAWAEVLLGEAAFPSKIKLGP